MLTGDEVTALGVDPATATEIRGGEIPALRSHSAPDASRRRAASEPRAAAPTVRPDRRQTAHRLIPSLAKRAARLFCSTGGRLGPFGGLVRWGDASRRKLPRFLSLLLAVNCQEVNGLSGDVARAAELPGVKETGTLT